MLGMIYPSQHSPAWRWPCIVRIQLCQGDARVCVSRDTRSRWMQGSAHAALPVLRAASLWLQVRLVRLLRRLFLECIGGAVHPVRIRGVALISPSLAFFGHLFFGILVVTNAIGCLW